MLKGEPSFLFLAFITQSAELVESFRKGEKIKKKPAAQSKLQTDNRLDPETSPASDTLVQSWGEESHYLLEHAQARSEQDIPASEFDQYQGCLEETLEEPNEVWAFFMTEEGKVLSESEASQEENDAVETRKIYTFIRHYPTETPEMWYVVIAKETESDDQIELLDAFPSNDSKLVQSYRVGKLEIGPTDSDLSSQRVIH
jgi:hypothetical protein